MHLRQLTDELAHSTACRRDKYSLALTRLFDILKEALICGQAWDSEGVLVGKSVTLYRSLCVGEGGEGRATHQDSRRRE